MLKEVYTIGTCIMIYVNASILYKNQEKPTCKCFSSFQCGINKKEAKMHSDLFAFIPMWKMDDSKFVIKLQDVRWSKFLDYN